LSGVLQSTSHVACCTLPPNSQPIPDRPWLRQPNALRGAQNLRADVNEAKFGVIRRAKFSSQLLKARRMLPFT
jgi:hypothetical protein